MAGKKELIDIKVGHNDYRPDWLISKTLNRILETI